MNSVMRKNIKVRMSYLNPQSKELTWIRVVVDTNAAKSPMTYLQLIAGDAKAVCMYTEKNDTDGKEIYEADIMQGDRGISYVVEYNRQLAMFTLSEMCNGDTIVMGTKPLGELLAKDPSLRVVGNVCGVPDSETNAY